MNEIQKSWLVNAYEEYEKDPVIKALIQVLEVGFPLPIFSIPMSLIGAYVTDLKAKKLKTFFDELNKGDVILTEEEIKSNDFMNAYFETVSYVLRTKSDEKLRRFANILKKVYAKNLSIAEFEDYIAVFNDLTDREFAILEIKHRYEQENIHLTTQFNECQLTNHYWENFKKEVITSLSIKEIEINSFLVRIQRTGCYLKHKGYWDESLDEIGNTTPFFNNIRKAVVSEADFQNR